MKRRREQLLRRKFKLILMSLVSSCIIFLTGCFPNYDPKPTTPTPRPYSVNYIVRESAGTLIGEMYQLVNEGEDAATVTIVPNLGYYFEGWTDLDGNPLGTEMTRQETNVQSDLYVVANFYGPRTCNFTFVAGEGGSVDGATKQSVIFGGDGATVTAIPDEGYRFVGWSDGVTEAERDNKNMYDSRYINNYAGYTITAQFERYQRRTKYNYNGATSGNTEKEVTISLDNISDKVLVVPERENCKFEGWYSDWHHTTRVSDENGKLVVDEKWLNNDNYYTDYYNPEGNLYAKWTPTVEVPVYKILLVFVTELQAELTGTSGKVHQVNYVMTDTEREICELIAVRMSEYLNAIFKRE